MIRRWVLAAVALVACGEPMRAQAGPMLVTESATVSGSLAGVAFTNVEVNIVEIINPVQASGQVTETNGVYSTGALSAQIQLYGIGSPSTAGSVFSAPGTGSSTVGLVAASGSTADGGTGEAILAIAVTPGNAYALNGPISLTGTAVIDPNAKFLTTSGYLIFTSATGPATFTASTTVPEPSSLALCGAAALVLWGRRALSSGRASG